MLQAENSIALTLEKGSSAIATTQITVPSEVYALIKRENIRVVDFKFTDLFGQWQHFSVPASEVVPKD